MTSRPRERSPSAAAAQPEARSTRAPAEGSAPGERYDDAPPNHGGPARERSARAPAEGPPGVPGRGDLGPQSVAGEEDPGAGIDGDQTPPPAAPRKPGGA